MPSPVPDPGRARLYGDEAARYDQVRPGYPPELFDHVLGPDPGAVAVLDVGCGTGIAARPMAQRGATVLGVEASVGMAAVAAGHGIPVEVSRFEDWDPAGRLVDRVTSAQAWHWIDQDLGSEKAASALRPGGRLCVWWSAGHHPEPLALELEEVYRAADPDGGLRFGYGADKRSDPPPDWSVVTAGIRRSAAFGPIEERRFEWRRTYTADEWCSELRTHSDHAALPDATRSRLLDGVRQAIERAGGSSAMTFTTVLFCAGRVWEGDKPRFDRLKQLPDAEQRAVHEKPQLLPAGTPAACGAEGRLAEKGQSPSVAVPLTFAVPCRMPRGHSGLHVATERWQWYETWAIWAWE